MSTPTTRLETLKAELRARLGPVCESWPDDLFESMVQRLAELTDKYNGSASPSIYDRRATERLAAEKRTAMDRSDAPGKPSDEKPS